MTRNRTILLALVLLLTAGMQAGAKAPSTVDVAIVLDTSGSMEQLLDSVRARLWDVIGELGRMEPTPELRVGLIAYGTTASKVSDGWIVRHADLTDDLDTVYASLMGLETGGSEEFVGRALGVALDELSWSPRWDAMRLIFVAGNESADQGVEDFDFRVEIGAARDREIIINALYAGARESAILEHWPELVQAGGGSFSAIDPKLASIQIATPYDDALLQLNMRLNGTYVPYGEQGTHGLANQVAQDSNASRLGVQSCSSRIVTKGTKLYTNAQWDLVDASQQEDFRWESIDLTSLQEHLRDRPLAEIQAHVRTKLAEREAIQLEIQQLSNQREEFIRAAIRNGEVRDDIGEAMKAAIREQAALKGFHCDGC